MPVRNATAKKASEVRSGARRVTADEVGMVVENSSKKEGRAHHTPVEMKRKTAPLAVKGKRICRAATRKKGRVAPPDR